MVVSVWTAINATRYIFLHFLFRQSESIPVALFYSCDCVLPLYHRSYKRLEFMKLFWEESGVIRIGGLILFFPFLIGPAVRADFRRLYPANAKTPTCCPSDDNRTKVTNSVTSARSLWWHVGPYFWPADLTRTANPTGIGCRMPLAVHAV